MATECPNCRFDNPDDTLYCGKCGTSLKSGEDTFQSATQTLEIPTKDLTRGSTLAERYEIIEELGKGGMGRVYRVVDKKIDEEVALKILNPEISADKKTIQRFQNELKLARKIAHRNVCHMYHLGEEEGTSYITMEYVPGEDLKGFLRRSGQLSIAKTISVAKQVCEGLAEAHRLGVVHRDLKPQNIMIDKEGNAKIMDFGIARSLEGKGLTREGAVIGTPDYMSPEQVDGVGVDQRSDIYAMGVILFEMATGRTPFEGETPFSVAVKHKTEAPSDPRELNAQIPDDLSAVILKCLEKDRVDRYQSVEELLSELNRIEEGIPTTERVVPKRKPVTSREITVQFKLKKLLIPVSAFVMLIIAAVIVWQLLPKKEVIPAESGKPSVAVLPFEDLSPQQDLGYFCDGFAESLITALTKIKDLRVPAPTSSFLLRGKTQDMQEIGEKLRVNTVFRGSVQTAGNRVRITAQLINVADESLLWSEQYNRDMDDVFAVQDEITLALVDKLKIELLGEERLELTKRYTENSEAYKLYLKGIHFGNIRSEDAILKGKECHEKAIEIDPDYALAYVGIAICYSKLAVWGFNSPNSVYPKAKTAIAKALELDPNLANAHAMMSGIILWYDWDWPAFENHIKRAFDLNPGLPGSYHLNAEYLGIRGRFEEAIKEIERAMELDPLAIIYHIILGRMLLSSARWDDAMEQIDKTLEINPHFGLTHSLKGLGYQQKGRHKEAIVSFQKGVELTKGMPLIIGFLGEAYARLGQREKAMNVLHELEEQSRKRYVPKTPIAGIYLALGEIDRAFELYDRAYEERDQWLLYSKGVLAPESLQSHPKYMALLKKLGLE